MSEVKIITAFTPTEQEAHITASDDAAIYEGVVGSDGVLDIGEKLRYEIVSNNKIKIYDGVFEVGGHFARIPQGSFVEVTIQNGTGGKKRNDLIVAKLLKNSVYGDSMSIAVKKGAETVDVPKDPGILQGNIYEGGEAREFPLYRVRLNGITIEKVERVSGELIPNLRANAESNTIKLNKLNLESGVKNTGYNRLGNIKFANESVKRDLNYTVLTFKESGLNGTKNLVNSGQLRPVFYFAWMQKTGGITSYMLPYRGVCIECMDRNYLYFKNPSEINWTGYTLYVLVAYYD